MTLVYCFEGSFQLMWAQTKLQEQDKSNMLMTSMKIRVQNLKILLGEKFQDSLLVNCKITLSRLLDTLQGTILDNPKSIFSDFTMREWLLGSQNFFLLFAFS